MWGARCSLLLSDLHDLQAPPFQSSEGPGGTKVLGRGKLWLVGTLQAPPSGRLGGDLCIASAWRPCGRQAAGLQGCAIEPSLSVETDGSAVSDVADGGDTPGVICLVLI